MTQITLDFSSNLSAVAAHLAAHGFTQSEPNSFRKICPFTGGLFLEIGVSARRSFCINHSSGQTWWQDTAKLLKDFP